MTVVVVAVGRRGGSDSSGYRSRHNVKLISETGETGKKKKKVGMQDVYMPSVGYENSRRARLLYA